MNVLSLFNGFSGGKLALETLGVEVGNYYLVGLAGSCLVKENGFRRVARFVACLVGLGFRNDRGCEPGRRGDLADTLIYEHLIIYCVVIYSPGPH